ncbi:MAG: radical SAM protein [Desulfurococcaceae archaeon]
MIALFGNLKVYKTRIKNALSRSGLPDIDYALNPYIGCSHGCIYCYARLYTRHKEVSENWGEVVIVKENIVEVLKEEVTRLPRGTVGVSTITDPYQPIETFYKLTRSSIKVLLEHGFRVSIQTKNPLVLRDVDLLSKYADRVDVGFTITTLEDSIASFIEPKAPPPRARSEALAKISGHGIKTWIFYGPIIPGLNDDDETIDGLLALAKETGSTVYYDRLHVKPFMNDNSLAPYLIKLRRYDWRQFLEKLLKRCRTAGVECRPGLDYEDVHRKIDDYLSRDGYANDK